MKNTKKIYILDSINFFLLLSLKSVFHFLTVPNLSVIINLPTIHNIPISDCEIPLLNIPPISYRDKHYSIQYFILF